MAAEAALLAAKQAERVKLAAKQAEEAVQLSAEEAKLAKVARVTKLEEEGYVCGRVSF